MEAAWGRTGWKVKDKVTNYTKFMCTVTMISLLEREGDMMLPGDEREGDMMLPGDEREGDMMLPGDEREGDMMLPGDEREGDMMLPGDEREGCCWRRLVGKRGLSRF